jgi:DNA-binding transcriptional MerR regulator
MSSDLDTSCLSAVDVVAQARISYRQLDHWAKCGYLTPDREGKGSGVRREWPVAELEIARRMGVLTAAGIRVGQAAVFAREKWPRGEIAPGVVIEISEGDR